jgi:hypothetical protein
VKVGDFEYIIEKSSFGYQEFGHFDNLLNSTFYIL